MLALDTIITSQAQTNNVGGGSHVFVLLVSLSLLFSYLYQHPTTKVAM